MNRLCFLAALPLMAFSLVTLGQTAEPELTATQRQKLEKVAAALNAKGFQLYQGGNYDKATEYVREALTMRRALYPKNKFPQGHPDLAASLNNLGFLLESQGKLRPNRFTERHWP